MCERRLRRIMLRENYVALMALMHIPVPYIEVAEYPAAHFFFELVHVVSPCCGIAADADPLRHSNRTTERFPKSIDSPFAHQPQPGKDQVLHSEQRTFRVETGTNAREIVSHVIASSAYFAQSHASNLVDGIGPGGEKL